MPDKRIPVTKKGLAGMILNGLGQYLPEYLRVRLDIGVEIATTEQPKEVETHDEEHVLELPKRGEEHAASRPRAADSKARRGRE